VSIGHETLVALKKPPRYGGIVEATTGRWSRAPRQSAPDVSAVQTIYNKLPDAEREVILLSRIVGLPHEKVARTTGRTAQATRSLLHRALARLADNLEAAEERE
jgi:DNA-directed RNA polymerase specialized sigma24 family protein